MRHWAKFMAAAVLAMFVALSAAISEEPSKCVAAPHLLWGDGEHDDTAALNAWFQGETVIWARTHDAVGEEIADRTFLLSSAIYISSGTGRKLERFRMIWPERNETVSGGSIVAGNDPDKPPVAPSPSVVIPAERAFGLHDGCASFETRLLGAPQDEACL